MTDEKLMHRLKKTAAMTRRAPSRADGGEPAPACGRGHGYILKKLTEVNGLSQQQLADALGVRPQTVSEALAGMERQGLIERRQSEADARVTLVYITAAGVARSTALTKERQAFAEAFFAPLTDAEKETLFALLCKLTPDEKGGERA